MKKEVGSGSGSRSRSISQRYGSGSAPKCHGSPTLDLTQDGDAEDPEEEPVQHHGHVLPVLLHLQIDAL